MSASIEQLNKEWKNIRQKLREHRLGFDDVWREKNKEHNCPTRVCAENGEWFCEHLTKARNNHFKKEMGRIDSIVGCMISITN